MESEDSSTDDHSYGGFSSRNSLNGSVHSTQHPTKTGRKGDPRMHRAVGARLANPKISLFNALKIGGFLYENDDDANAVDSEQITLAQRKNQLSRRIRLAQKLQGSTSFSSNSSVTHNPTTSASNNHTRHTPDKATKVFQNSGSKRPLESPHNENSLPSEPVEAINDNATNSGEIGFGCRVTGHHIRAKQHPDYHPLVVPVFHRTDSSSKSNKVGSTKNGTSDNQSSDRKNILQRNQQLSTLERMLSNGIPNNQKSDSTTQYTSQHQVATPSAVAITSLNQTAASVGMTLEQLALSLRSSNNLSKILMAGPTITEQRQQLALALYQSENRCLYQRAMLLAGYPPEIVQNDHAPDFVQFMITAWQMEGERLTAIMSKLDNNGASTLTGQDSPRTTTFNTNTNEGDNHVDDFTKRTIGQKDDNGYNNDNHHHHHHHSHNHDDDDHHHSHNHDHTVKMEYNESTNNDVGDSVGSRGGRHIHRLEGKCGHQPVLHQPLGGKPHIDFVIGDRVECYHNVQPAQDLMWPSNYNCEDISCTDPCHKINSTNSSTNLLSNHTNNDFVASATTSSATLGDPKVYERSELDFESDEWNFDFSASDSLLGLFKLGDTQQ